MTKQFRSPNSEEGDRRSGFGVSGSVIRISFVIRHSDFVIQPFRKKG